MSDFTGYPIEFYIHKNRQFRLLMGRYGYHYDWSGTGMAPMRAFYRRARSKSASGKNWLIFGETTFYYRLFYQTEIQCNMSALVFCTGRSCLVERLGS